MNRKKQALKASPSAQFSRATGAKRQHVQHVIALAAFLFAACITFAQGGQTNSGAPCQNVSTCNQTNPGQNDTDSKWTVLLRTMSPLVSVPDNISIELNSESLNKDKKLDLGIVLEIWNQAAQESDISMRYTFSQNYKTDGEEDGAGLADVILLHNESVDHEGSQMDVIAWPYNERFYTPSSVPITYERYFILFPTILFAIINQLVWQFLFIFLLTYLPWLLVNTQIKYFFMEEEVKQMNYFRGFLVTMKTLFLSERSGTWGVIYSIFFIVTSALIITLILSDYIYIIALVLKKQNIQNIAEIITNNITLCLVKTDTLAVQMIQKYELLSYVTLQTVQDCISFVNGHNQDSALLISEFMIRYHYTLNTGIGFQLKYIVKQNSIKEYPFLAHRRILNSTEYQVIQATLYNMIKRKEDQQIIEEYLQVLQPVSGDSQSLWTREKALYFGSLSVIFLFVAVFFVMLLRNEKHQIRERREKRQELFMRSLQQRHEEIAYSALHAPAPKKRHTQDEVRQRHTSGRTREDPASRDAPHYAHPYWHHYQRAPRPRILVQDEDELQNLHRLQHHPQYAYGADIANHQQQQQQQLQQQQFSWNAQAWRGAEWHAPPPPPPPAPPLQQIPPNPAVQGHGQEQGVAGDALNGAEGVLPHPLMMVGDISSIHLEEPPSALGARRDSLTKKASGGDNNLYAADAQRAQQNVPGEGVLTGAPPMSLIEQNPTNAHRSSFLDEIQMIRSNINAEGAPQGNAPRRDDAPGVFADGKLLQQFQADAQQAQKSDI